MGTMSSYKRYCRERGWTFNHLDILSWMWQNTVHIDHGAHFICDRYPVCMSSYKLRLAGAGLRDNNGRSVETE